MATNRSVARPAARWLPTTVTTGRSVERARPRCAMPRRRTVMTRRAGWVIARLARTDASTFVAVAREREKRSGAPGVATAREASYAIRSCKVAPRPAASSAADWTAADGVDVRIDTPTT